MFEWLRQLFANNPEWHWHETASGPVMRRWANGAWETRQITHQELHCYEGSRMGW
jgi:hypothetical protein